MGEGNSGSEGRGGVDWYCCHLSHLLGNPCAPSMLSKHDASVISIDDKSAWNLDHVRVEFGLGMQLRVGGEVEMSVRG